MAQIHSTRHFATDEHGTPLGVTDSAFAQAEVPHAEVRHALDGAANVKFIDGHAIAAELEQAHKRIAALEGTQGPARAPQTPLAAPQRPAPPAVDDATYAGFASHFGLFPCPSLNGAL